MNHGSEELGLVDSEKADYINFTIKNYNFKEGVSYRPYDTPALLGKFELMGPIGRPLMPNLDGVNIAFAAGTGTLTFMDFVAALARFNLGTDSTIKIGKNFKFVFFASFQERAESLGVELCEALHAYC